MSTVLWNRWIHARHLRCVGLRPGVDCGPHVVDGEPPTILCRYFGDTPTPDPPFGLYSLPEDLTLDPDEVTCDLCKIAMVARPQMANASAAAERARLLKIFPFIRYGGGAQRWHRFVRIVAETEWTGIDKASRARVFVTGCGIELPESGYLERFRGDIPDKSKVKRCTICFV